MKFRILFILLAFISFSANAQTQVPNGDFESWTLHDEGIAGGGDYWLPDSGWNENISNSAMRFYNGTGYFYRYEESDANGYAMKLRTIGINGFNRFQCDEVPKKLKGRYKFSDSGCDDFTIYAYAVNSADTLPIGDLFLGTVHSSAKSFKASITESFHDFEIDLANFKDVDIDYFIIMFKTSVNGSCIESSPIGDIRKSDANSYAVIDDLELAYETPTSVNTGLTEPDVIVFPNPTSSLVNVKFNKFETNSSMQLFDVLGNMLIEKSVTSNVEQVDLNNFSPGIYFLHITQEKKITIIKQ